MFAYLPDRSAHAVREHAHLLDLLESGDAAEIERYARWHKMQTVEAYRALHSRAPRPGAGDTRAMPEPATAQAQAPWPASSSRGQSRP
jgi:hypothetical protein